MVAQVPAQRPKRATQTVKKSRGVGAWKARPRAPRASRQKVIGILYGEGCDFHCVKNTCILLSSSEFKLKLIDIKDVRKQRTLESLDVLLVGGGDDDDNRTDTREGRLDADNHYGRGQRRALGKQGMRAIVRKVKGGLMYVGICAGAYLASAKTVEFGCDQGAMNLRLCEVDIHREAVFAGGVTGAVELRTPKLVDEGLRRVLGRGCTMRFDDSAVMNVLDPESVTVLATYKRPVLRRTLALTVPKNTSGKLAYSGTHRYLKHQHEMVGRPAVVLSQLQQGKVLLFGPHPELHPVAPGLLPDRSSRSILKDLILNLLEEKST
ncbi:unnamed protein product [Polarella glacialis]|uniref:Biotin-protein ligase N-terminal domain-containing protein n=1 Tax=Polarella glacialis TaxID=89957 RepID=A0A813DD79_POLGL|nr:unnamed protein product [Polarella glacialis]CAE8725190.1 unnamed protein product [Polarella glacialis]|mmetsp:Transcript_84123/g.151848  ORF Transcript_84123/g.151848 Transcript_84123/m.151848 type:complete len:322 (+) Transcript_84123:132-1097(+)